METYEIRRWNPTRQVWDAVQNGDGFFSEWKAREAIRDGGYDRKEVLGVFKVELKASFPAIEEE